MASYDVDGVMKVEVFVIPIIYGPEYEDYSVISHLLLKIIPMVTTQVVEAWYRREVPVGVKLLYEVDPEPEPEPGVLFKVRVTTYGLCIRNGPASRYTVIGHVKERDILNVYKVTNGWYKIDENFERWIYGRYTQTIPT